MNITIWLALALVLVVEGLGPMLFPQQWRRMLLILSLQPDRLLRRVGGGLVIAGVVVYFMLTKTIT